MEITINSNNAIYQYFERSHIEEMAGRSFTDEQWDDFINETEDDFAYYASKWMEERLELDTDCSSL